MIAHNIETQHTTFHTDAPLTTVYNHTPKRLYN